MSKIKKFEDIESWKSARKLTKQIYQITSAGEFMRDFGLKRPDTSCVSINSLKYCRRL
jgi:hypothetical protein